MFYRVGLNGSQKYCSTEQICMHLGSNTMPRHLDDLRTAGGGNTSRCKEANAANMTLIIQ